MAKTSDKKRVQISFKGVKSKTVQAHAVGVTPREIYERSKKTGQTVQELAVAMASTSRVPRYDDVSNVPSAIDLNNRTLQMARWFESLPPELRDRYGSLSILQAELQKPEVVDELVKLGYLRKAPPPEPVLGSKERPMHFVPPAVEGEEGAEPPPQGKKSGKGKATE